MRSWWWRIQERRLRKARADIDRILGGMSKHFYVPNQPPPPAPLIRAVDYFILLALVAHEHLRR